MRQLDLAFARAAHGGSELVSRRVSYPWSLTQPFRHDDGVAYVIPQSASGGLFRGEDIRQRLTVGEGASVLMRTQGATLVHRCDARPARSFWEVDLAPGGRAELVLDPIVLGPGASLEQCWDVTVPDSGRLLLIDGWTWLEGDDGPRFAGFRNEICVRPGSGAVVARERMAVSPAELRAQQAMAGQPIRALATAVLVRTTDGDGAAGLANALRAAVEPLTQCWTGVGLLPGGLGVVLRAACVSAGSIAAWSEAIQRAVCLHDNTPPPADSRRGL